MKSTYRQRKKASVGSVMGVAWPDSAGRGDGCWYDETLEASSLALMTSYKSETPCVSSTKVAVTQKALDPWLFLAVIATIGWVLLTWTFYSL